MNEQFTKYWIENRPGTVEAARHYREEYGESWLTIKRKENVILQGMAAAAATGDSSWFFHFKLIAFQTLIDFEDRYGENWPPLKSRVDAILEKALAGDIAEGFRLLQEAQRYLEAGGETPLSAETCRNLPA
jgi:hypothetical protein